MNPSQTSPDAQSSSLSSRDDHETMHSNLKQSIGIDRDDDAMMTHNKQHTNAMDVDNDHSSDDDDDDLMLNNNNNQNISPNTTSTNQNNANNNNNNKTEEEFDVEITEEDYESIAIMIDELMKDDPAVRIKAIRSLPIISKALGEERTRSELIPYITQMIDDDDEVLLVLIEEIYRLLTLKLIGGDNVLNNEYSYCLIPPFERLCQVEEKIIRDEATTKFGKIIHDMPYKQYINYFDQYILPLFKRLCNCDWHTARISGATLIANAFSRFVELLNNVDKNKNGDDIDDDDDMEVDENKSSSSEIDIKRFLRYKNEMLSLLTELCSDSIPIVRRSAIISLGKMVSCLNVSNESEVLQSYLPLFKKLASDDQDNVRVFAIETLIEFGNIFNCKQVKDHLLYHIRLLALDSAWRVRYIAADNFINLCKMLDLETIRDSMINYFIRLLQDQEPEVRAVAISKIPGISSLIGIKLSIQKLIPIISRELIVDSNKYARASLASIIIPFCYLLPHQIVIDHILQCILKILKDEYPNVRLHVISNICDVDSNSNFNQSKTDDTNTNSEDIDIEIEIESDIEITIEIDEEGNEIEIADPANTPNIHNRERKLVQKKRKQKQQQKMDKMKKFDISLLEESIIPSIMELTLDNDWRVRLGIIEKFPSLAKQFGLKFFNERLFDLCLASLADNVADIRLSAATNLFEISEIFNKINNDSYKWTKTKLIPSLIEKIHCSTHYLHRLIYLLSFQYLSQGLGVNENDNLIREIIYFMEKDKVANVRFKSCQIISFLLKNKLIHKDSVIQNDLLNKLQNLSKNDDDIDVRYFANDSIDELLNYHTS